MNPLKKKPLLINPSNQKREGLVQDPTTRMMPLALGIVAALTPENWEVELLDENFERFTYRDADLVGFTAFTATAMRAYEIAAIYREKGIYTVMGGIHASMYTQETLEYFDSVVTGEAEGAFTRFLADFEAGNAKKLYDGGQVDISKVPDVKRSIFKYPYIYELVQTSRGCPNGCDFCSVTQMCGKTYRERDVDAVLNELEKTTNPLVFFVDDNLVNNKKGAAERAIRLFKGMVERKMNKLWVSQAALNFADDDEVLYWARKSGCMMILMGVEAETPEALKSAKKNLNLKKGVEAYEPIFKKIHKHGIGILATLIFAMESDNLSDLYARRDFIKKSSFDSIQVSIMTPVPGTALYHRMHEQNRITAMNYPSDWQFYEGTHSVLNMPHLNTEQIKTAMKEIWMSLYSKEAVRRMLFRTIRQTRSFQTAYWAYGLNHMYSRMFLEGTYNIDAKGKGIPRSFYLRWTDQVVRLLYLFPWKRISRKFAGK
jgi:radical SAM superfamily enzyme YgiQ (UPF0313 family)